MATQDTSACFTPCKELHESNRGSVDEVDGSTAGSAGELCGITAGSTVELDGSRTGNAQVSLNCTSLILFVVTVFMYNNVHGFMMLYRK